MRTNGLNVQECRGKGCGQLLVFIRTKASNREKATPCEYPPVMLAEALLRLKHPDATEVRQAALARLEYEVLAHGKDRREP